MQKKHIAIAGNIGSGKTTLTKKIAAHYGFKPVFADADSNPYLYKFYEDMAKWSFHLQIYLLSARLKQLLDIEKEKASIIQDRTIYEDVYVFSTCLNQMNLFSDQDYATYRTLFETLKMRIQPPTLVIYLSSSPANLVEQISKRGRSYEENIHMDYLKKLNTMYATWAHSYKDSPLIQIDVDTHHFDNPQDMKKIIARIDQYL